RRPDPRRTRHRVPVGAETRTGQRRMRPGEPLILWDWTFDHLPDIGQRLIQHLGLTSIAVGIGFVLAFILSPAIRQAPVLYSPVSWVAGVFYSIPSLAL